MGRSGAPAGPIRALSRLGGRKLLGGGDVFNAEPYLELSCHAPRQGGRGGCGPRRHRPGAIGRPAARSRTGETRRRPRCCAPDLI